MDNYDKARKVLQSTALSKIAQQTGISIGQIWHYRDRHEGIEKGTRGLCKEDCQFVSK